MTTNKRQLPHGHRNNKMYFHAGCLVVLCLFGIRSVPCNAASKLDRKETCLVVYQATTSVLQSVLRIGKARFLFDKKTSYRHVISSLPHMVPTCYNPPSTPTNDQCQISPAASPEILHHTVWRTWLCTAYSNETWLYCQYSLISYTFFS